MDQNRYQLTDRPKHGMWWVWDMLHKPLPTIVGRYWSRDKALASIATLNAGDTAPASPAPDEGTEQG